MHSSPEGPSLNLLYLYDLPKDATSSTKLAVAFKEKCGVILDSKPQIRKDISRPFYSAIVNIKDPAHFELACKQMRYFEIEGKSCRALRFDKNLLAQNREKLVPTNVFVRNIPKSLKPTELEDRFSEFGEVKSLKVSLNQDHTSRGYGFIQFLDESAAQTAIGALKGKSEMQALVFEPRDRRQLRRLVNNIYVKNIPKEIDQKEVRKIFAQFGEIKSIQLFQNDIGQFGFVCFDDPQGRNKEYGPECANKAIESLNESMMGNNKLYVRHALKKADREQEKRRELLKYKNSKKRCNLYAKNLPSSWNQDDVGNLFSQFGEIENMRLDQSPSGVRFCFVCFMKPEDAANAKQGLNGRVLDGKSLSINHYEIKEIRQVQMEDAIDQADFEKFKAQELGETKWTDLQSQQGLVAVVSQLLNLINVEDVKIGNKPLPKQAKKVLRGFGRGDRQQAREERKEETCPPMPGSVPPQPNIHVGEPGQMDHRTSYLFQASKLLPSVTERNPYLKEQVGTLIFDFVTTIIGAEKAPKITGMLIELPVPQIKKFMSSFESLEQKVSEANSLLMKTKA